MEMNDIIDINREDLKINRFKLEEECVKNVSFHDYVAEIYAQTKAERDKKENELKKLMAEKDLFFRKFPPKDLKVTESVISSLVETDSVVVKKKKELLDIRERYYMLEAFMSVLESRKYEVQNLVKLWIGGYYNENGINNMSVSEKIRKNLNNKE